MLPIEPHLSDIHLALAANTSLVLQAAPGAGKSTCLPLSLIDASWRQGRKIVMLEPRRVAARAIAHYLSRQLGEPVGKRIGYHVRNDKRSSADTVLELVTEGMLTRRLQSDPELQDTALIIFDEFHERSIHSDLGLLLARECQLLRDDLKLLVMSATIDTGALSQYLDKAPVIQCEGRAHAVSVQYQACSPQRPAPLSQQTVQAIETLLTKDKHGDILVFLPGLADIRRCMEAAQASFGAQIVCQALHGGLTLDMQEQALQTIAGKTRIIFASNIAETSLTVEGVFSVIDAGLEKVAIFDAASGMTRLDSVLISKASATQRMGRAGRLGPGYCIRLWDEAKQRALLDYQRPEIERLDLSRPLLECCQWGMRQFDDIEWFTPPPSAHVAAASDLLSSLDLIDQHNGLTLSGKQALHLAVEPRIAAMLADANDVPAQALACDVAALLGERDILRQQHSVDFRWRLEALQSGKAPLVKRNADALRKGLGLPRTSIADNSYLAALLFKAFPDRVAQLREPASCSYKLANGRGVRLADNDTLRGQPWLLVLDADAQKREGRILSAISLQKQEIADLLHPHLSVSTKLSLDQKQTHLRGEQLTSYRQLTLKREILGELSADDFQNNLPSLLREHGFNLLNWDESCQSWLQRVQWLSKYLDSFPALDEHALLQDVESWLLPYCGNIDTLAQLRRVALLPLLQATLSWDQQQQLENAAPIYYAAPSGKRYRIRYEADQGPTVAIVLQEMFGELSSPMLAEQQVPLRFELLSPAKRPLQTTSDLAGFWQSSYFDIAKEMRGRYPKHRWPEQPLDEKPGHSLKRRNPIPP